MGVIIEVEPQPIWQLKETVFQFEKKLPTYKNSIQEMTIERMQKEQQEEKVAEKWK
jgi:hypothetical protein